MVSGKRLNQITSRMSVLVLLKAIVPQYKAQELSSYILSAED